jgi:hypothetical protein
MAVKHTHLRPSFSIFLDLLLMAGGLLIHVMVRLSGENQVEYDVETGVVDRSRVTGCPCSYAKEEGPWMVGEVVVTRVNQTLS